METIGITAAFHDTACLLVDNLDLIVVDHIFYILIKQRIRLEKLINGMNALSLHSIVLKQLIFLLLFLFRRKILVLHSRKL